VASGLTERTEVSQYRLAAHLVLPCLIFVAAIWAAQHLVSRREVAAPRRIRASAIGLIGLTLVQIYFGALLAGLRGGLIYNTWPLIEGRLIPPAAELGMLQPTWRNVFENILTVQFDHRVTAYLLFVFALLHAVDVARTMGTSARASALTLLAAVTTQASLGILTLVHQVPLVPALSHQGMAIVVLAIAAIHAERLWPAGADIRPAQSAPSAAGVGRVA
jgi:cytochrome c oxidase assembly protein subunit 15